MSKCSAFFLLMVLSSAFFLMSSTAYVSTTKPAVPEFSLILVKHTYDLPPLATTNPFTGENRTITGRHWEWLTIDVLIKNQNFDGTTNCSINFYSGLMYNVRYKGHYSNDWTNISATSSYSGSGAGPYLPQNANAAYTTFSIMVTPIDLNAITSARDNVILPSYDYPNAVVEMTIGGQVEFQVESLLGTSSHNPTIPFSGWAFSGQESGWRNTQSITIDENNAVTAPLATPTVTVTPTPFLTSPSALTDIPPSAKGSQNPTPNYDNNETVNHSGTDWTPIIIGTLLCVVATLLAVIAMLLLKGSKQPITTH
jgi:hypothetical protein